jgi:hypothetical protein
MSKRREERQRLTIQTPYGQLSASGARAIAAVIVLALVLAIVVIVLQR